MFSCATELVDFIRKQTEITFISRVVVAQSSTPKVNRPLQI